MKLHKDIKATSTETSYTLQMGPGNFHWDFDRGMIITHGLPSVLLWSNPSLLRMLLPLAEEVGVPLFRLMVAQCSSLGTDADYNTMITVLGKTFEEGFLAWGVSVSTAGWGRFELRDFDKEAQRAVVVVQNPWELEMQRGSPTRWGCPFLQGKVMGIFSHAFGVNCWADEIASGADAERTSVQFDIYPSERTIEAELAILRRQSREEAKRKLAQKTQELWQSEARQRAILASLSEVVFTLDDRAQFTSYHVPREQAAFHDAPERVLGRHVREVMSEPIAELLLAAIAELGDDGAPRTVNYTREQGGEVRFFSTKLSILQDPVSGGNGVTAIERDITDRMRAEQALTDRLEVIQRQQDTIQAMSTPIIQVWDGVLALPLVGLIDSRRAAMITESLLDAIVNTQARVAILDMTGVDLVDTAIAEHFVRIVRAVELLGAECVLTGMQPAVAQTLSMLDVGLGATRTFGTMRSALMAVTRGNRRG
ncbi:STAS domain-containing protein [Polyangium aurulentum]|uniref:STAS domain-containing protein n=1 Tax=Polyangium aurulentum TaxID=2567896 RepID=UPI0010AE089D|nr:STAS domain-containing protein [Polyangium aurulentum]UQA62529.1 STAS domain-containing protein [Polyangium aurulentum]